MKRGVHRKSFINANDRVELGIKPGGTHHEGKAQVHRDVYLWHGTVRRSVSGFHFHFNSFCDFPTVGAHINLSPKPGLLDFSFDVATSTDGAGVSL